MQEFLYTHNKKTWHKTINTHCYNKLMNIETHMQIGNKCFLFPDKSRFHLGYNSDGCICIGCYTGECHIPKHIIQHHSECWIQHHSGSQSPPASGVWSHITKYLSCYELWVLLTVTSTISEILEPEVVPFLQGIPEVVF